MGKVPAIVVDGKFKLFEREWPVLARQYSQPSIADLSLLCEIMQLQFVDETESNHILGPFKKVQQWIEDTKNATRPHFDEVHQTLFGAKAKLQMQQ
uniref:GST C-terminal domain-containing protein n=1 Tax=Populus trichocarpa TaxID=3694 RepID=A0A2K2BVJ6_POPTR